MTKMSRILIADHHGIFAAEMKEIIEMTANLTVADRAADGEELLRKIRDNEYDLLLLDLSLPGGNALKVISEAKTLKPKLPVLILGLYPEDQYAVHALKLGGSGYLPKGCSTQELREALQTIAAGKVYLSASMRELRQGDAGPAARGARYERLSDREYQVMLQFADGKTNRQVGEELMVGVKTIDSHCSLIQQKMGLNSIDELIRYAVEHKVK